MKCCCIGLLLITIIANICNGLEISSKLDFGNSKLISTPSRRDIPQQRYASKREKSKEDFDNIGVICITNECNKTEKNNESPDESVKTDVVVHVETIVDVKKNKTNFIDDTPDVPVVVGLAGTNYKVSNDFESATYGNPQIPSTNLYGTPLVADNLYIQDRNRGVNVKTLPSVAIGHRRNDIAYNLDGLNIKVPHFQPTYARHFGQNLPTQSSWYPIQTVPFNPVEFKNTPKTNWDLSYWNRRISPTFSYKPTGGHRTDNCDCNNQQGLGLQRQPNDRGFTSNNQDPGRQINDKLAPLN